MKSEPVQVNGPAAMARLDAIVRKVLTVSHEEIKRREAEYARITPKRKRGRPPKTA